MEPLGGTRTRWVSRFGAIIFLSASGLVAIPTWVPHVVLMCIGFGCLLASIQFQEGVTRALELLLITNVAFWCFVGLVIYAPDTLVYGEFQGLDPRVGSLIIWLFAFCFASIYELLIFLRVLLFGGNQRRLAAIGFCLVAVQAYTAIGSIMWWIYGV